MSQAIIQDSLKTTLHNDLLNTYKTDNSIYNIFLSVLLLSLATTFVSKLNECVAWILCKLENTVDNTKSVVVMLYNFIVYSILRYEKESFITKEVVVDYITDNKHINELYKAVYWYLSNAQSIDYVKETPIKYTYENRLEGGQVNDTYNLNQILEYNNAKSFKYEEHEIHYRFSKELISVYCDQEKKKENYKIILKAEYSSKSNEDILNKFCQYCISKYIENISKRRWQQQIFVNKDGKWEAHKSDNKRSIDTVVLKNNLKNVIKRDIKDFIENESWYVTRDVPYTRGYLFYGQPGCGKTSMIKAISNLCERNIHYLMLNNIKSDNQLIELLKDIDYKSTILVIEDIDCMTNVIKERTIGDNDSENYEKIKKELSSLKKYIAGDSKNKMTKTDNNESDENHHLTLSGLLNAIDGVFSNHGRILIMTTNHPEKLDKALVRPGRIDKRIHFENCNKQQVADIFEMFFGHQVDSKYLESIEDNKYSPAYITKLLMHHKENPNDAFSNVDSFGDL